jgi:DNA-directed RNA polymerase subunit E'/Rpb7
MLRLYFTDIFVKSRQDRDKYEISYEKQNEIYFMLLKEKNIFVNSNRIIFLSLVHDIKIVQTIQEAILDVLNKFFKAC